MFRNFGFLGAKEDAFDGKDKPKTLPEHLQMSVEIANSMQSVVSMLVREGEPSGKIQEEMEPLHRELTKLLQASIEVNKENDKRHKAEIESSKFVMDQVQSQLIAAKKEATEATITLQKTKVELEETKTELKQTKKDMEALSDGKAQAAGAEQQSQPKEEADAEVEIIEKKVESLQKKLNHRQSRIDNLQHILNMKDREHEVELSRQKAKSLLNAPPESDTGGIIENLQAKLDETMEELEDVRDELEQQTELMIEAEDKLKEADKILEEKAQMENRLDFLSETLHNKTTELYNLQVEHEQMHTMVQETKAILNDQSQELQEKDMELQSLKDSRVNKSAADEGALATLKDELEATHRQLEDRDDEIKHLRDDLQNSKEIMDIQAQVLQEHKNNPSPPTPPSPPPQQPSESDDEHALNTISIEEHMEAVRDLQQQLEDARDKIANQSQQINEQYEKIDVASAPWRQKKEGADEPTLEEVQKQLNKATERNQQLERQIDEIEDNLKEAMEEIEHHAALVQSKDEIIQSLENGEEELEAKVDHIQDSLQSNKSLLADELKEKERIIESLEIQLLEADDAIQELQKKDLLGEPMSTSKTRDTGEEEREAIIESLEMKLKDADTTIRKLERRVHENDRAIDGLEQDLEETRKLLEESQATQEIRSRELDDDHKKEVKAKDVEITRLKKKIEDIKERALSEEQFAEVQKALLHANKSIKKGQKQVTKLTEQLDTTELAKSDLERKLSEVQKLIDEKDGAIQALETKVEGAEESLALSQKELIRQAEEMGEINAKLSGIQKEAREGTEKSEAMINDLRETVASKDKEIAGLKKEHLERASNLVDKSELEAIDELKTALQEKERLTTSQEKEIESMRSTIQSLSGNLDSKPSQEDMTSKKRISTQGSFGESAEAMTYQELKERLEYLEEQQVESLTAVKRKEQAMIALQKELDTTKEDAQNLVMVRKELDEARMRISELNLDSHTPTVTLPESKDTSRSGKEKSLQESLDQKEQELDKLKVDKQTLSMTVNSLKALLTESEGKLKTIKDELQQSQQSFVKLGEVRDKSIQSLEKEIGLQTRQADKMEVEDLNKQITMLKQQLEESEETIRILQRRGQQIKRKSMKARDEKQSEVEKMREKVKSLEGDLRKEIKNKRRILELEERLELEVEQSVEVASKKQAEIDVLRADLRVANSRIEDLAEAVHSEREKQVRQVSKGEHQRIDLVGRLEQEMDHSESLKKQLDTYKHSLKAKRKIIDSQTHELRSCQDKLDMHDSITRKTKRKMNKLENEIWNLEGELENINMHLRNRRPEHHRSYGGGPDARGMNGMYIDNIPVNQYLNNFSKKVVSARRQLEAVQDRYRER